MPNIRKQSHGSSLSRRSFLASASAGIAAVQPVAAGVQLNGVDRQIWEEELAAFVPKRIFDVHTHLYPRESDLDGPPRPFPESDLALSARCEAMLLPGREISRLAFPSPFPRCDFEKANRFVAEEIRKDPRSEALMLVHPSMTATHVEASITELKLLGFKPYRRYCRGDVNECRITDLMPEHQLAVANRHGLIVMLHISMKKSIADPRNISAIQRLSDRFPKIQWILAHCARSYGAWAIEKAAPKLRGLPNVWYETSPVCSMEAFDALFSEIGADRVMHGADGPGIAFARGMSITYGFAWGDLTTENNKLDMVHCDGQMTFYLYEQLRAMRRAMRRLRLTRTQIEDVFYGTASRLVGSVARAAWG
jgi:hypothetical protein